MDLPAVWNVLILLGGFVPLLWGADRLVEGGSGLAQKLRVPPLVIGLTIVAFGTSAPELVVNLVSAFSGDTELAMSNVVGSNIFNLLGILGVAALVFPLRIAASTVRAEVPLMVLSAVVLLVIALDGLWGDPVLPQGLSVISRGDGLVLLAFFLIFLAYSVSLAQQEATAELPVAGGMAWYVAGFWIVAGLGALVLGGQMIVQGAVGVARQWGLSERVIGLTIVAVGTSLPELATSVTAALKKQSDIAVGNVVGSNIFNLFFILGLTAAISPVPVRGPELADLAVNLAASCLLFVFIFLGTRRTISRPEGGVFLALYILYVAALLAL